MAAAIIPLDDASPALAPYGQAPGDLSFVATIIDIRIIDAALDIPPHLGYNQALLRSLKTAQPTPSGFG